MEFEFNKKVYFKDKACNMLLSGRMNIEKYDRLSGQTYIEVIGTNDTNSFIGHRDVKSTELFDTFNECIAHINAENNKVINNYKSQINSVEDLIRFLYMNPCNNAEEYTDYLAAEAAKQKALELLNIKL